MTGLRLQGIVVRFGGLTAVDGVTLEAPPGRITGLIGPNGAGKTTLFNVGTGLVAPTEGTVWLDDREVTNASPDARARQGLGRSFQRLSLFDSLSVRENVLMGFEAAVAGRNPLRHVLPASSDRERGAEAATRAMARCGITDLAGRFAGDLPTGQRRLVDLARVLAGDFRVLLLDEPSSGLDSDETVHFGDILSEVVHSGVAVLLVEHDMRLVLSVCDHLHVLEFGRSIAEGPPQEVVSSPVVRAAYLGTHAAETQPC